jgi:phosphohistidine phosphatase SixA
MILYLMRHGEALTTAEWSNGDSSRPLSKNGEKQLNAAVTEWARVRFAPETVLTSPLVRAQQTAAYVSKSRPAIKPTVVPELTSGVRSEQIKNVFVQPQWSWPLLYVGHMPDLALFSSRITHDARLIETNVEPAEMLAFETDDINRWGAARLMWRRRIGEWSTAEVL